MRNEAQALRVLFPSKFEANSSIFLNERHRVPKRVVPALLSFPTDFRKTWSISICAQCVSTFLSIQFRKDFSLQTEFGKSENI